MIRKLCVLSMVLALLGCTRSEFLGRVEAIQNGSRNSYFAAKQSRQLEAGQPVPTENMGVIRRPPPEPKPEVVPKTEEPTKSPQQQYIYMVPVR